MGGSFSRSAGTYSAYGPYSPAGGITRKYLVNVSVPIQVVTKAAGTVAGNRWWHVEAGQHCSSLNQHQYIELDAAAESMQITPELRKANADALRHMSTQALITEGISALTHLSRTP
jgi:hypothetical protein